MSPAYQTQPRDRRALSHFKHGLTGEIYLLTPAEQAAYESLRTGILASLSARGELEIQLAEQIVADRWRLNRAAALESSIFAEGVESFAASPDATDDPDLNAALAQGRTWLAEAKNLNLLTLYESRIHRRFEKSMAELHRLQAERKAALAEAVEEAALLSHYAQSKGEIYDIAEPFAARGFEFSRAEISKFVSRWFRLEEAKRYAAASRKAANGAARVSKRAA